MFGGKDLYRHFWGKELYHIYFEVTFINRNNFHIFKVIINLSIYTSLKKQVLRCNSHQYKTASGKIILLILIYYCLQIKVVKYYGQYLHLENQREGVCGVIVFHFQQYFSYIVAVRFIDGGNQSTQRKPPTCRHSPTNLIT